MLLTHALQMVRTVSTVVTASRSDARRLGSRRGPTPTAGHVIPLRLRWRSQGRRRATSPPSHRATAPQDGRDWARRGPRHRDPVVARGPAGTTVQDAPLERGPRRAGPGGGPAHGPAPGLQPPRGCRMPAPAPLMGREAVTGRAIRWQGARVVCALVCHGATGTGAVPVAPVGAGWLPLRHDAARVDAWGGPLDLDAHPA